MGSSSEIVEVFCASLSEKKEDEDFEKFRDAVFNGLVSEFVQELSVNQDLSRFKVSINIICKTNFDRNNFCQFLFQLLG